MASIDERVVSMAFENGKFEKNAAQTLGTLKKLNDALKLTGAAKGLQDIQAASEKINLANAAKAADGLKGKFDFSGAVKGLQDVQAASDKVTMEGAGTAADGLKGKFHTATEAVKTGLSTVAEKLKFPGAERAFDVISGAASRVNFGGLFHAFDAVRQRLSFPEAPRAFAAVESESSKVHFTALLNSMSQVTKGFSVIQGAAAVAFGNLATKVVTSAGSTIKGLSIGPLVDGFHEYATNLNSIQTILANTKASGATLNDVNKALQNLNLYSDKTIYNFSQMAKNIGTFTAAGVDLDTATTSIKGIANLAAVSGSSADQASTAMYQLSQAISAGRVSLQDWNSVVNAGMGGTVFQRALAQTAQQMGTIKKGALELKGPMKNVTIDGQSFRESITAKPGEQSWLTSKVLTNTLKQFSGDLSEADLKAQGFNDSQIKAIQAQAKMAVQAATQVKTFSQFMDTTKEAIGSGWSQTWQLVFGDFAEAKTFWTGLSNSVNGFISSWSNARNNLLKGWKELGGRKVLIEGLKAAFDALMSVLKPIKDAFREIFPAKTAHDLFDMTVKFRDFMKGLKIGPETAENLKNTFKGFFAILSIGKSILKGVGIALGEMFGAAGDSSGGFLKFTGGIGNFIASLDSAIKKSDSFFDFFRGIGKILSIPIHLLGTLGHLLAGVFGGVSTKNMSGATDALDGLNETLSPLQNTLNIVSGAWDTFLGFMERVGTIVGNVVPVIRDAFKGVIGAISNTFTNANWSDVFTGIQTGLLAGIFLAIKKALGGGIKFDPTGGIIDKVKGMLDGVSQSLKSMQQAVKAATILEIAVAIGVLAAGVALLATIDPKRLTSAMTAVAVGLGELVGAMALLRTVGGGFIQMPFIASSLILLAGAVDILAVAVKVFSKMSWEELIKGLAGVAGVLVAVAGGVRLMPTAQVVAAGAAMVPLSAGIVILAGAVKIFATMHWEDLAKGLLGVVGALTAVAIGINVMPVAQLLAAGPGLILVSAGLIVLSGAVASFGNLDLATLGKGLLGIAASLVVIGAAISAIPPTAALQGAALIVLGIGLSSIATAVALMGGLGIGRIAKGLLGLGGALVVLAVGLTAMAGTLPGAAALVAAAAGLDLLVPALFTLGNMKWKTILKGLAAIALSLGVIGAAGLVAGPGLVAVGAGLTFLGLGLAAIGGAVYLTAKGISLLADSGQKGITNLMLAITAFVALIPTMVINFVKGLVAIAEQVALVAPKITAALASIIGQVVDLIVEVAPKAAIALGVMIDTLIALIGQKAPPFAEAAFKLLESFLKAIDDHLPDILPHVEGIIVTFLGHLAGSAPRLVAAGVTALVKFLGGIVDNLPKVVSAAAQVVTTFIGKITNSLPGIIASGAHMLVVFLNGVANKLPLVIGAGVNVIIKFLDGVGSNIGKIERKGVWLVGKFLDAMSDGVRRLADKIGRFILNVLDALDDAIVKYSPQITSKGLEIGKHLIEGMVKGIFDFGGVLRKAIQKVFGLLPGWAKDVLGISSPSKVFATIGRQTMDGIVKGVTEGQVPVRKAIKDSAHAVINAWTEEGASARAAAAVSKALSALFDPGTLNPVITPVVDSTNIKQLDDDLAKLQWFQALKATGKGFGGIDVTIAALQADIARLQNPDTSSTASGGGGGATAPVQYIQNNYSPKALTPTEVYRQTNNQLAPLKRSLGLAPATP